MKEAIEKILESHGLLEAFSSHDHYSVRIENDPYLPLCIEKHGPRVSITHYFEQYGDLVPDPDMEFEVIGDEWSPVAIQFATGTYRRGVVCDEGRRHVKRAELADQKRFAKVWGLNLLAQGFERGQVRRSEPC